LKDRFLDELTYERDSNPFNTTLAEWTALWWKWMHSIPRETSPALDATGQFSGIFQVNPSAFFLAGTEGGSATRKCTMPQGKAIFFPVITCIFSFALDPDLETEEELTREVTKDIDRVERMSLRVDQVIFEEFSQFRVRSDPFDDIINGMRTKTVSDGYWIFLKPLAIGNHNIHFTGRNFDFFNEVDYHIEIIRDHLK
jgi:hypothetical protein